MNDKTRQALVAALWEIYDRDEAPLPWQQGSDFPWHDPDFGRRTLLEHLDERNGAASRTSRERQLQLDWLWQRLALQPEMAVLDVTCGPGLYAVELAQRGCNITGIDINPAAIEYARALSVRCNVADRCHFIEQDVRQMPVYQNRFDAAIFLYEQLAVYPRAQAQELLQHIAQALKPGGRLCVEILNQDRVDKEDSSWWFTDDQGLWGDAPFLHLGERIWNDALQASIERYLILHLETGRLLKYALFDQTYAIEEMVAMMYDAGFSHVEPYPNWAGLPLYDAGEWVVYVAHR